MGPWTRNPKASIGYWRLFRDPPRFCSDHPDGTIEVGNWFGVDYQGKGYASEALRATLDQIATDPDLAHRSSLLNVDPTMRPQSGFWPRPAFTRQAVQALALTGSNLPSGKDRFRWSACIARASLQDSGRQPELRGHNNRLDRGKQKASHGSVSGPRNEAAAQSSAVRY
ncbi:GNAT family N-acetyltransferase [Microvirga ossetica]|uniref:GNAT family N-acetyltransferase n=1 Tax=Microvirga ossetica TaxID=1882682 RepID=UPI00139068CA